MVVNGKAMINLLLAGLIKKTSIKEYFPKPRPLEKDMNVEWNLSMQQKQIKKIQQVLIQKKLKIRNC